MQQRTTDYRPAITGLRGVACLIVVFTHTLSWAVPATGTYISGTGKIGVWLFFTLSAFLLTEGLIGAPLKLGSIAQYLLNRTMRIFPPLLVALAIYSTLGLGGITDLGVAFRVATLQEGPNHFWTIPTEFKFYLVLPVAIAAILSAERVLGRHFALGLIAISALALTALYPPSEAPINATSPRWFGITFGAGIAAAWILSRYHIPPSPRAPWLAVSCLLAVVVVFKTGLFGDPLLILVDKHVIFGPLWAVAIYGTLASDGLWSRLLAHPAMVAIGGASYSIYIYHWMVIELLVPFGPYVTVPFAVIGSIVVGMAGAAIIERPVYAARKLLRFPRRPAPKPAA